MGIFKKTQKQNDTKARKSIQTKITLEMSLVVAISLVILGGISILLNELGMDSTLGQTMTEMAVSTARGISYQLESLENIVGEVGATARIANPETPIGEKRTILQGKIDKYGLKDFQLLSTAGVDVFDGTKASDKPYFKSAMRGEVTVNEPIVEGDQALIMISGPVWEGGKEDSRVVGVVVFMADAYALNQTVASIEVSANGGAYIVGSSGVIIAHKDMQKVLTRESAVEMAKTNHKLDSLAAIEKKMVAGETGFEEYHYDGVTKFNAFAPIPNSGGWSIAINAPVSDFDQMTRLGIIVTVALVVAAVIVAIFISRRFALQIAAPLSACAKRLELMSEGDFDTPVPEATTNDEIGEMLTAAAIVVNGVSSVIKDIDYVMDAMGNGDYTVHSKIPEMYKGSFSGLFNSIRAMKVRMEDLVLQIRLGADQITLGASQVSDGAQMLAQGAVEQASSIEELSAAIQDISGKITENSNNAKKADDLTVTCGQVARKTLEDMNQVRSAMSEISTSSVEIEKIIKAIDDIAFQTNILALNAAVEAARAGSAGKGFAVVADEVRSLAGKSAEAAKTTAALIEGSIVSVNNGDEIVQRTYSAFEELTKTIEECVVVVNSITEASEEQACSVREISVGMDQISAAVQTISATSEESAATSEELSGQANMLDQLMSQFKLDKSAN